ncbi:RNA polymerase subunit sigma-70 [Cellulomonas cellasea]|uniref:RNA polymerase sigma70 factor n=2 Tax=Cellulomonas cellasea TaxID=43670 RepID=A0A0A0B9N0_9CELL|nr:RNA polymerase subunit sigma-70 [Cellulomonas cellasea]KGM01951.1 RNA polymerase sigma70 factor [Cellulomonas cellasea DSM 20118]GEA86116.1 DNA-directed RNA polymerase sigma-70 factor [Cellulomonas cellasea]
MGTTTPGAAQAVDPGIPFGERLEALRTPLTGYCYGLLGSAADADDAVQETLIRAAARADRYEPDRARLTTWVHRIATNVCLDMLRGSRRRAVPMDLGPAAGNADLGPALPADRWVEPMPDARVLLASDPADRVVERESVRFAFIVLLQRLPARQRAVLVLRDVLGFSGHESADILDTSVAAVHSALQRARAALDMARTEPVDVLDPNDEAQRDLLRRYVAAFEAHDVAALTAILREDAITSMPPFPWWLRGGALIAELMTTSDACAGDRLLPTAINGAPGFGQYRPAADGVLRPFALVLVDVVRGQVAATTTFLGTGARFSEFGLPTSLPSDR